MRPSLDVLAPKVSAYVGTLLYKPTSAPYESKAEGSYLMTCVYFLAKAKQNLDAVILLCRSGFSQQAMMIARSTFEMGVTVEYINKDISNRALLYSEYDFVERHQWMEKAEKYKDEWGDLMAKGNPRIQIIIKQEFARVKSNYGDRPYHWAGKNKTFKSLCLDINAESSYDMQYATLCKFTHNSITLANDYFDPDAEGALRVVAGHNPRYNDSALATAALHTLHVASHFIDAYKLDGEKEQDELMNLFKDGAQ